MTLTCSKSLVLIIEDARTVHELPPDFSNLPWQQVSFGFASVKHCYFTPDFSNLPWEVSLEFASVKHCYFTPDFPNLPWQQVSFGFASVKHCYFTPDFSNPWFFEALAGYFELLLAFHGRNLSAIYLRFLESAGKYYSVAFIWVVTLTEPAFPVVLFIMLYTGGSNVWVCGWNPQVWSFKWKLLSSTFLRVLLIMLYKVVLPFESVGEIVKCDHSNESYWAVFSCGAVFYAVQGGSNFWACGWNPKVWPLKWKLLRRSFLWYCLLCCTRWL